MSPDPSLPPDIHFVSLPKNLAQFHHLPQHVPVLVKEGDKPPEGYQFADGVKAMEKVLSLSPDVPGSYLYRLYLRKWPLWREAAPLLESGRVAEAIPVLVKALDLDPDCPLTCFQLGFCFRATGEYEKAESFYRKALTLAPESGWIHSNLGRTYAAWGKEEDAKAAYWEALQHLPGDTFVLEQLEALGELVRLGEGPEADGTERFVKRAEFEKKVAAEIRNRSDAPGLIGLGFGLLGDSLWDLAEECFERVREVDPHESRSLLGLGVAHLHRGHPAEAERWLEEFLEKEPLHASGHLNLFKAQLALERSEEAWDHLQEAVRLDPSNAPALEQMARFLTEAGRGEEARARLRELSEANPTNPQPLLVLARLFAEAEDPDGEWKTLDSALERAPDDTHTLLAYTAALGARERPQAVVDLLRPKAPELPFELTVNLAVAFLRIGRRVEARGVLEAFQSRTGLPRKEREKAHRILQDWDKALEGEDPQA